MSGCVKRYYCANKPVQSSGCRGTFHYPKGGSYSGYWLNNKNHGWGIKTTAERSASYFAGKKEPQGQLIYKGNWVEGKRSGCGSMIRKRATDQQTIYSGEWDDDMKCGEGKHFYSDGSVYFGQWVRNRRHGLGIQWYTDGSIYLGQWETGFKHGLGVLFYANGNQYEGHFSRGFKNGEGVFYHMHTGQVQKGMWENDNARTSLMQDNSKIRRNDSATPYPMPPNRLKYPNEIIHDLFREFQPLGEKPHRRFNDMVSLEFVRHQRQFASFEERMATPSGLVLHP